MAVSIPVKSEIIELSDSDDSTTHVAPSHANDPLPRRSTRTRKASQRFSPDDDTPAAPNRRNSASTTKDNGASGAKRRSYNSDSSDGMRLIEPQALIDFVEKSKRKIRAGQFGINMPVGPGQFVLVDAADYLRNLGYSDFEETGLEEDNSDEEQGEDEGEEMEHETDFLDEKRFKEEVTFEPQAAAEMGDEGSNESEEKKPEVNFWDKQIGEFMAPSSVNSTDSLRSKSEDSVDVEALDPAAFNIKSNLRKSNRRVRRPHQKKPRWPSEDEASTGGRISKQTHNDNERMRRRELANQFASLFSIVFSTDKSQIPKVRILGGAIRLIQDLKKQQVQLACRQKALKSQNQELTQLLNNLITMQKAKYEATKKTNPNQEVKNYVNSL